MLRRYIENTLRVLFNILNIAKFIRLASGEVGKKKIDFKWAALIVYVYVLGGLHVMI